MTQRGSTRARGSERQDSSVERDGVTQAGTAAKARGATKADSPAKEGAATRQKQLTDRHDSGGKVRLALAADVVSRAVFDGAREEYRYVLHRRWAEGPTVLFVMMNPSTADIDVDDPTVAKCQRYARRWGYGAMYVANTFGYRVTDQKRLLELKDPVGPGNDEHIREMARESELIVLAYGKPHARLRQRGMDVQAMLSRDGHALHALKLCLDGTPAHPLYLRDDVTPVRMDAAGS